MFRGCNAVRIRKKLHLQAAQPDSSSPVSMFDQSFVFLDAARVEKRIDAQHWADTRRWFEARSAMRRCAWRRRSRA